MLMGRSEVAFLEHVMGKDGVSIPEARAAAIGSYITPTTKKGLRSFLGTISYYRKFVRLSRTLTPATSMAAPPGPVA